MADVPNLSGIATEDLVDTIGAGSFSARYINWAKTLNLLHEHAPGWLPHIVHQENGEIVYGVADSAYVLIYFIHTDETSLPPVMQAIMDNRHKAIPFANITAVDVSNAVVRGYCKAAAVSFGLAYELWSGDQMESGYSTDEQKIVLNETAKKEIADELVQGINQPVDIKTAQPITEPPQKAAWHLLAVSKKRETEKYTILTLRAKSIEEGADQYFDFFQTEQCSFEDLTQAVEEKLPIRIEWKKGKGFEKFGSYDAKAITIQDTADIPF
tara:strand:- start:571 stop:1377 length:807 start_codon:yes stop_codon:yes gene_type:complete